MSHCRAVWVLGLVSTLVSVSWSCSSATPVQLAPIVQEGPDEAIVSIGRRWEAQLSENGTRSRPSAIASFERQSNTLVTLTAGQTRVPMSQQFYESFVMVTGEKLQCNTQAEFEAQAAFGLKNGETVLQLSWSAASISRVCLPEDPRIPALARKAGSARFALRSDRLVAIEPALEKREFIPVD